MKYDEIKEFSSACEKVGERLLQNRYYASCTEARPTEEVMVEVERLFEDFFTAEVSDRFGEVHFYTGTGDDYLGQERTVKVDDKLMVTLTVSRTTESGITESFFVMSIDGDSAAKIALNDVGGEFSIGTLANITSEARNISPEQIHDSLETMRELHRLAFGEEQ